MAAEKPIPMPGSQADPVAEHLSIVRAFNRRRFMRGFGMAGVAAAGTSLLAGCGSDGSVKAAGDDTDVLNFALNLEYFEATLYGYLVNGTDIPAGSGGGGTVQGAPAKLTGLSQQATDLLNEIYFDELSHVNDLRSALSSKAVARPTLKLDALGAITASNYISYARLIEDVGVTAYAGAVTAFGTAANLQAAAQILAVEAFHSGALRLLAIQTSAAYPGPTGDNLDIKPADPGDAATAQAGPTQAVGGFFATAGAGTNTTAQSGTGAGMAYRRSTSQVLAIVYGSATTGTSSGGFFPSGLNGNIKTV